MYIIIYTACTQEWDAYFSSDMIIVLDYSLQYSNIQ